ncbi:ABC transporter ATP-binding protein [Paramaledivibacter caminithermalis]|jgi:branched-chain amino acid transport system ATP-binding protein|uniref:Amino acid/amide ABC transporter ATP-binding protein 2, HAAT family n=1 Tax=Paramaledivibacter caminithermalis (strain DSM 15212 / CIP 107654 / DViRD3) TaxID=1121301 RepID=A0A1M6NWW6_PARC5|nr:ABC transporter ATP-binding protein [Paramaledivibacter caminithermalis]SHK00239.1 amino acid/amide ABC transporter ATP-binding protein 2, HAAT family [Paramaledivibacter caminithermalis DSM 15212]
MLKIRDLNVHYGGIHALKGINIDVPENKIVTLIGANGAGKSTTLRSTIGLVKSSSGKIIYNDKDITNRKTKDIVSDGLVMVPEGRRVFPNLTVEENLILGAYIRKDKNAVKKDMKWVYELFPRLKERIWQKAGTMSGGEQQMLAVGRALMTKPKLLMMDEPSLGLAPLIVKEIFEIISEIHKEGVTILLIEQNAKAALEVAHYGYVLETGSIVLEGKGMELLNNDEVQKAYLGE